MFWKAIITYLFAFATADVYLHNPRGSNNRCDELSNNRQNANRMFDSENNAAGGYAVTCDRSEDVQCYKMKYYERSMIPIRWTAQHNCGENNHCQIIIQYSCESELGPGVRDGSPQSNQGNTCTERIPENNDAVLNSAGVNISKYGLHEDYDYYERCLTKKRNVNLFTADQKLRGSSGIYTRQNPNGNRHGFECPEERDYYPYWGESNWKDIAVLTSNTSMCEYYKNESRCTVGKEECIGASEFSADRITCEEKGGVWKVFEKYDCNITCGKAPTSTINRLGIANNSTKHTNFDWYLPTGNHKNCVIRVRYNISTNEVDWNFNKNDNDKLENNPIVNTSSQVPVRLAVNTAQYGRTFEDRSYTFDIISRPEKLKSSTIHNINVQGKRGNIAQVRNCIEYDFVPNKVNVSLDDYIHFQFIGSDYNPKGNDGEGRQGTDRSNVVEIYTERDNTPAEFDKFFDYETSFTLASIYQPVMDPLKCYTFDQLLRVNDEQSEMNCALLNRAPPYFNMFPVKVNKTGRFYMMSSRNNNFSNRGQKLIINSTNTTVENNNSSFEVIEQSSNKRGTPGGILAIVLAVIFVPLIICGVYSYRKRRIMRQLRSFNHAI